MAELDEKIKKQIEFYFGDSNFSKDKYMRALAAQNSEGYCPISTLLTFNRLKALTTETETIVKAIQTSDVVEVNQERTMIKRKNPLPVDNDTSLERTIYAKGWKQGYSIEDIEKVMSQYGKVLSVRPRKQKDKSPKDSAYIEFSTVEEAKAAIASPLKHEGVDLILKSKPDYMALKKEEIKKRKEEKKQADGESAEPPAKKQKRSRDDKKEEKPKVEHPKGTLMSFKDIGDDVTRELIKEAYAEYGNIAYVDFDKGDKEGIVRFDSSEATQKAIKSDKQLGGKAPTLAALTDEESDAYWAKSKAKKDNKRGKGNNRGKKKRTRF